MKIKIDVSLKQGVLDPQGKAIETALHGLGFGQISAVRVGKVIDMNVATNDAAIARSLAAEMADKLLANGVIEDYSVTLL
jgi:phosphoribosylformylglycinamidine synthase subunit PurS